MKIPQSQAQIQEGAEMVKKEECWFCGELIPKCAMRIHLRNHQELEQLKVDFPI